VTRGEADSRVAQGLALIVQRIPIGPGAIAPASRWAIQRGGRRMINNGVVPRRMVWTTTLGLVLGTGACATVSPDEFDIGLNSLRGELVQRMDEGDQALGRDLGGRIDGLSTRVDGLEGDLRALEDEFGVTVERLETALRFHVPVYFEFDEAELGAAATPVLARFGEVAQQYYEGAHITVEGFTDPAGSAAYNLRLGQRRADAVRTYLIANAGVPGERIRAVSYGEDTRRLVVEGESGPGTAGWENRRVVVVVDHAGRTPVTATQDQSESQ